MAIQDDFVIDTVNRRIYYATPFVYDRPPTIYTVNQLYSWLMDTFDEPGYMQYSVPMSAQTPTQYTIINSWFVDDTTMKTLYGGSIQTSGWLKSGAEGITQLRWKASPAAAPTTSSIGNAISGSTSLASGTILHVDATRQVAWVRNTSTTQFTANENVYGGTGPVIFMTDISGSVESGESIWTNVYSVGSLQSATEVYIGQEDDYMGGRSYHVSASYKRRIEKVDEWWDSDVDFTASPNLLGGLGHFDVLLKTKEAGHSIDASRVAVFARQFSKVYSHFELVGGVGNYVVPFASTGADLNSQDGPYSGSFNSRVGDTLVAGDILENSGSTLPVGRLRAVVTSVTDGAAVASTFQYYLIGENEASASFNRTLKQLTNGETLKARDSTCTLTFTGSAGNSGPAIANGITVTFGYTAYDVDEDSVTEDYACVIDCNNQSLASVYKRVMFLTSLGNQNGTVANVQDTLLPTASGSLYEAGEFYRAIGDIVFNFDGGIGTYVSQGDYVTNAAGDVSGVVVAVESGATGVCVLTQVKGTFVDNDQIARPGEHATNRIVIAETPRSIVDNTGAPFGTFAGGRWFLAQGILLSNVPVADSNNWETSDLAGTRKSPPTVRTITFAGLIANDRAALFEVNVAGTDDVRKTQNGVGVAGAALDATTIPLDSAVALDVPSTGWIRVVDTSATDGTEYRYEYSAVSSTTVTLRPVSPGDDVCDAGGSSTILNDTGIATSFGTNGYPKVGMLVRNVTSGGWARVLRKISNDSIETTPLTVGTWATGNSYLLNVVVVALVDADTVYFPFIDDTATGTTISKLIKYVESTPCIARARFSDPDVGGTRILPYTQTNITITDADLTVTAIRTSDTIASIV